MTEHDADTIISDPPTLDAQSPTNQERILKILAPRLKSQSPWGQAEILAGAGLRASALQALQDGVASTSNPVVRAKCYCAAGELREQLNQFEAAIRCYRAVSPEHLDDKDRYFVHNHLGRCLNRLAHYAEAEAECRRAITTDAARFDAHNNLGIALERMGRLAEAAAAYRTAAHRTKSDERPLRRLRVMLANHPEIARDQPDLARDAETLRRSRRKGHLDAPREYAGPSEDDVRQLMSGIRVAEAIESNGLQVFGLYWERLKSIDYATLDDALSQRVIEITEVGEHGTVPTLHVVNRSDGSVLLMAGEQLVGAKQNRVLNASIMTAARSELPVPVTCVEQGRWAYRSRTFSTSGTSSHSSLRLMMSKQATVSYRRDGRPDSDQGAVWEEVARKLWVHESESPSHALHQVYESHEARLKDVFDHLSPRENWSGAAFAYGGSIIGLDLFDKSSTLRKLWPKLVRAYAIDALESKRTGTVDRSEVEAWVGGVSRTAVESFASLGIGNDVRLEGERLVGAMLMVEDVPVHLEVFADDDD